MPVKLYNTLTKQVEEFTPLTEGKVTLYTCGPTVYDHPHVGNWASFIYWDILVRTLIASGYKVERVMNMTDVGHLVSDADDGEDKLEKGARREGKTAWDIAQFYSEDFVNGMEKLGLLAPDHLVRATEFIPQQLDLVRILKEKGFTYQTTDGIYFDTSKFPSYASFAHLDLAAQMAGARVEANSEKRQPWDFALWKFTEPGKVRDMEWETPDDLLDLPPRDDEPVMGFPGWHLECSAMAMSILGPTIDIHTGGIDHIPVHHTNEIAQSEAASDQKFANYWLHNNHLKIDGGKVSKSLGNGYTLQDLAERDLSPLDYRLFILQGQFTNEGNFTFENVEAAKNRLSNWRRTAELRHQTHASTEKDAEAPLPSLAAISALRTALQNNLNTPEALRVIDETFNALDNRNLGSINRHHLVQFIEAIDEMLGLQLMTTTPDINDEAKRTILERRRARDNKDWQASDTLRDELAAKGIFVKDTVNDTVWSQVKE